MTLVFMGILRCVRPVADSKALLSYAISIAVLAAVAVLSELGQQLTHREPSMVDTLRDMAGIVIGLGFYAYADSSVIALSKQYSYVLRISALVFSVCLLVVSLFPLLHLAFAYVQRNDAFPVIIDFEAVWGIPFIRLDQSVLIPAAAPDSLTSMIERTDQQRVFQLTLNRSQYPGISMVEPYPDWSAYKTLTLELYSWQVQTIKLVLRIHDSQHNQEYADRFNLDLTVNPGYNRYRIPLIDIEHAPAGRQMDMKHIANIMLFAVDIEDAVKLYPGTLKLE